MAAESRSPSPRSLSGEDVATLERLREIVRLAPIGIGIVDREGHTVLTNDALCEMLGYTPEEFATLSFEDFTHPDDVQRNLELFDEMMAGQRDSFRMEKRFFHKDGHVVWGRLLVSLLREDDGDPSLAIGLLQDITEEKRLRQELERLAFHDPLTGLPNRRRFQDCIDEYLAHARSGEATTGAVLFVDVDDFKTLNDTLGHQAGDEVLQAIAQRLTGSLRPADTASRLGGDEFAILLDDIHDPPDALQVAERIQRAVTQPLPVADRIVLPDVSIGIAILTPDHDVEQALREADLAMYRAKTSEDDGIATYTPELLEEALHKLEDGAFGRPHLSSVPSPQQDTDREDFRTRRSDRGASGDAE